VAALHEQRPRFHYVVLDFMAGQIGAWDLLLFFDGRNPDDALVSFRAWTRASMPGRGVAVWNVGMHTENAAEEVHCMPPLMHRCALE
jgi:hypothetical protein